MSEFLMLLVSGVVLALVGSGLHDWSLGNRVRDRVFALPIGVFGLLTMLVGVVLVFGSFAFALGRM